MKLRKILASLTAVTCCACSMPNVLLGFGGKTFAADSSIGEIDGVISYFTFESSDDGWKNRGSATVEVSASEGFNSNKSLYVSGRTASWNGASLPLPEKLSTGKTYSFSANVKYTSGSATDTFYMKLEYKDASGTTCYDPIAEAAANKDEWVQLSNTKYTIPSDAEGATLYIETAESTVSFYLDDVVIAAEGTKIDGAGEAKTYRRGDLDGSGDIDALDIAILRKVVNGEAKSSYADIDQSQTVDSFDVEYLQQFVKGEISEFPVNKPPAPEHRLMSEYTDVVSKTVVNLEPNDSHSEKPGTQYGTVKSGSYYSSTCRKNKPYNILLPAGYSEDKEYPVLYVMHGYWETQDRMIKEGNGTMYTRQIIGNAIAAGEAEDMIVVFPYIYSSATQDSCSGMDDANNQAYDNFINDLTKDLMPYIEQNYSVKTGRDNTAITGFSMGGRESLLIGMQRPDLFGYVGAICPAPGVTGSFKWKSEEEAPYLLFITAGSNDEVVYTTPSGYHDNFTKNGVPHVWHYVNGGYHGDNSIHAHIYNFVRAVFKA